VNVLSICPFCYIKEKFTTTFFSEENPNETCEGWIDYEQTRTGKFLWYAFLSGEQLTKGHTIVVLGTHMEKITDADIKEEELSSILLGINRITRNLKNKLKAEHVHVLCLCEGVAHVHFHLIPRYKFSIEEKNFFINSYWEREKEKYKDFEEFKNEINSEKRNFNGMWYAAYHEMNFKTSNYYKKGLEDKKIYIENLAKKLRNKDKPVFA